MAGRSELDALLDLVGAGDDFLFDDTQKKKEKTKKPDKKQSMSNVGSTVSSAVHRKHLVEKAVHVGGKPDSSHTKPETESKTTKFRNSMLSSNGLLTSTPKGESNRLVAAPKSAKQLGSIQSFRPASPERTPENSSVVYLSRVRRLVRAALLEKGFSMTYKQVRQEVEKSLGTAGGFNTKSWREWFRTTVDSMMNNDQFHKEVLARSKAKAGIDMLESAPKSASTSSAAEPKRKVERYQIDFGEEQHDPEDDYEEDGDYEEGDYEEEEYEARHDDARRDRRRDDRDGDDRDHDDGRCDDIDRDDGDRDDGRYDDRHHGGGHDDGQYDDDHYEEGHHDDYGPQDDYDEGEYDENDENEDDRYYENGDYVEEDDDYDEEEETAAAYKARMRARRSR